MAAIVCRPSINFNNILIAAFFALLYQKHLCKMLMKLTPREIKAAHKMLM